LDYQICECESQQETIASLKQQLADAELRNSIPVVNRSLDFSVTKDYHGEIHLDKGNKMINNSNEGIHLQVQVYLFPRAVFVCRVLLQFLVLHSCVCDYFSSNFS